MNANPYEDALRITAHRPYPMAAGPWRLRQRWRDLLFAHWPIPTETMAALLPPGLEVDTFDGSAWAGVVPFWMDQVHSRLAGNLTAAVPTTTQFNELNLRTYVRSRKTGKAGVFFFALDCDSPLSVIGARTLFHLPYYFASMNRRTRGQAIEYRSRRIVSSPQPVFEARYQPVRDIMAPADLDPLARFLTERYCLFTPFASRLLVGEIHHAPWPLQPAEADFRRNEVPGVYGLTLPDIAPVLHFAKELYVNLWGLSAE